MFLYYAVKESADIPAEMDVNVMSEEEESSFWSLTVWLISMYILELLCMMLKFMVYLKGFEKFGNLVELIKKCFWDILDFTLIFMLFNLVFVIVCLVMEVDIEADAENGEP